MNTAFIGLVLLAASAPTSGDDASPLASVQVVGACPNRAALLQALLPALGAGGGLDDARGRGEPIRVVDLGDRYEVAAAGQTNRYVDVGRDCDERARIAAVFIALALNPPAMGALPKVVEPPPPEPPPVREPPPTPPPPPPEPEEPARNWESLTVAGRVDVSWAESKSPSVRSEGGELRIAMGHGLVGGGISAAALMATTRTFHTVEVREQRFPASATFTLRGRPTSFLDLAGDVGVALTYLTLRGGNLIVTTPASRLDVGARAALEVRGPLLANLVTPFLGFHFEWYPKPYVLQVSSLGDIGTSSRFWLGATLGLSFESQQ